jgi:hypothetical protein
MTAVLGFMAAAFLAVVLLLACADAIIRHLARRRDLLKSDLGPAAELAVSGYLAETGPAPSPRTRQERAVLLQVGIDMLGDLQGSERDRLARLLDEMGYVEQARGELESRRSCIRRGAAERLAVLGTPAAVAALRPALADQDVLVRCTAGRMLAEQAEQAGDDPAELVLAVAEQAVMRSPGSVRAIVLSLGRCRPQALEAFLRPAVNAELRIIAIEVAGALRLAGQGPALRACLSERGAGDEITAAAATALGKIGEIEAVPALMVLAAGEGRSAAVRIAAASALGGVADPAAVPALGPLLFAGDWSLRTAAARSLAELGADGQVALRRAAASSLAGVCEPARVMLRR